MIRSLSAGALVCALSLGDSLYAQQTPTPQTPPTAAPVTQEEPPRPAIPNTLMDGTEIKLRLAETISSADAHVGQTVPFEVIEDISVQGVTVIPKGAAALATVTTAEAKKRMGRGGKLDVNIDSTRLTTGEKIQLRAVKNTKGGGHVGVMTGAMVATGIVFFPAAPLFLFMHGKDITIPKGTEISAFVQGDTKLDMAKLNPSATPTLSATALTAVSLNVDASASGADIEIDGEFVGNTPSAISVKPGSHTIVIKKKGFADWTRKMNVSGSGARVSAELEQQK